MRRTHEQLVKKALSYPDVKKEYDALSQEFSLLRESLNARLKSDKPSVLKSVG